MAAVVAGGDLTVAGSRDAGGAIASKFTGLLYTDGNLTLTDTRTVGAAIAAGTGEVGSLMTIQDSDVISSPEGQDVSIAIQGVASGGPEGGRASRGTEGEAKVLMPTTSDRYVDGHFITDPVELRKLIRVVYGGNVYNANALPADAPGNLQIAIDRALPGLVRFAEDMEAQNERKPVQIVRFDLNEFLNVSDRLRASQPFYLEN